MMDVIIASKSSKEVRKFNKERSIRSIQKACSIIKQSRIAPFVEKLILYGSAARGEQTYSSDIDLLLVLKDTDEIQTHRAYLYMLKSELTSLEDDLPDIDLNIVIGNDWEKNEDLYYKDIRREGIDVWKNEAHI